MNEDLRSEVEKIKKDVEKLASEVENIKGRGRFVAVQEPTGELRREPKEVVAIEKIMREMTEQDFEDGALIHAGCILRDGKCVSSWVNTSAPVLTSSKEISKLLSPFSSEQRISILGYLYKGFTEGKTVSELVKETGYEGGQLYHHLRELERVGYLETKEERGRYFISAMGRIALLTVSHMASALPHFVKKKLGETEEITEVI